MNLMTGPLGILLFAAAAVLVIFLIVRLGPAVYNVTFNLIEVWRANGGEKTQRILGLVDNVSPVGCTIIVGLGVVAVVVVVVLFATGVLNGAISWVTDQFSAMQHLQQMQRYIKH
jgi:hypothetical protein